MFKKITHITVFVSNQDEALNFYKKLGFVVHTDANFGPMRWLTLNLEGQKDMELVLLKAEDDQEKSLVGKQAGEKPLFNLETSDCFADYEKLNKLGINFIEKPTEQPWGVSAAFKDLDGNLIYMCQPR